MKALFDTNRKAFMIFTIVIVFFTIGDDFLNELIKIISVVSNYNFGSIHREAFYMFNPLRGLRGFSFAYFCIGGLAHGLKERILRIPPVKKKHFSCYRNRNFMFTVICERSVLFELL